MKVLKEWVINDLGEIGGLSEKWLRVGLPLWLELAGVSESYSWSCVLPLGACNYFFLIRVTISKVYKRRVNFVWAA